MTRTDLLLSAVIVTMDYRRENAGQIREDKDVKKRAVWNKSLAVTIGLIVLIVAASFVVIKEINSMEEQRSFERLYEEAEALAENIERFAANDREELEMLSAVVAEYEDFASSDLWKILDSYESVGMMSRLEILLPDNTVIRNGGQRTDAKGQLSFEEEAALGAHITNRETDLDREDSYIVRHYVPIIKDRETAALLYGVIELGSLPEELIGQPYSGEAAIYIIDGNTGDFLVDTWHEESGNIWALGERKMAAGYNHEQLKQGLIDGKTGYVVFVSETIGAYLYFYYMPMGINEWRVALSVPESIVFENADRIENILNLFLLFEGICFILYFLWMLRYVTRETGEKQRQLDMIHYIYDVEKLLFNAHERRENMDEALGKIGYMTMADKVGFWMKETSDNARLFLWKKEGCAVSEASAQSIWKALIRYFQEGKEQLEAYGEEKVAEELPAADTKGLQSMLAVPVEGIDGTLRGVLAVCNMADRLAGPALLKSVGVSFSMFCRNVHTYNEIKEEGERDLLLNIYNRNRYEKDLASYKEWYEQSMACVYIDVNGLHELNNTKGHLAGDKMLREVAEQLKVNIGTQYAYRIGGDEFLAFIPDTEEDTVEKRCRKMEKDLEEKDIHVSVGIQWQEEISTIEELVKRAERKMYAAKKAYYEQEIHNRRARQIRQCPDSGGMSGKEG